MPYLGKDLPLGALAKPLPREKKKPTRIRGRGKKTLEYEAWRDEVAIPYLDKTFGHKCADCWATDKPLDVDHIIPRGGHAELKFSLENLQFLCRNCHIRKDGGMR